MSNYPMALLLSLAPVKKLHSIAKFGKNRFFQKIKSFFSKIIWYFDMQIYRKLQILLLYCETFYS